MIAAAPEAPLIVNRCASPSAIIRRALPSDAEAVAALGAQVAALPLLQRYGVSATGLALELQHLALRQPPGDADQDSLVLPPSATRLILAERAGVLLGFARFQREGSLGAGGYLQLIALRPDCSGGGIGGALLDAVEAEVAACSPNLFLLTSDFNAGAQRFYERRGYQRAGALPAFARPDIVELLYWKRVRPR